jgi:hypothetical protein
MQRNVEEETMFSWDGIPVGAWSYPFALFLGIVVPANFRSRPSVAADSGLLRCHDGS